jgi:hypothetical protein
MQLKKVANAKQKSEFCNGRERQPTLGELRFVIPKALPPSFQKDVANTSIWVSKVGETFCK